MNEKINPVGLKGYQVTERMKELMGIKTINENKKTSVVELTKKGPDGNIYAIVRENHEYYIKITKKQSNIVVEDFQYIGGLQNKKQEVYSSYAKAIKHLNLKFHSLNEAYGKSGQVNVFLDDKLLTEDYAAFESMGSGFKPEGNMEGHMMSECCGGQVMEGMCLECGGPAYGGGMNEFDKPAMDSMKKQYGDEEGEKVYYATANKQDRNPETFEKNEGMGMMDEKKFPDLNGDGEVTYADILKGRGVKLEDEDLMPEIAAVQGMMDEDAPIRSVTTMDGNTIVGSHQHGVGFKPNQAGIKMGFKDDPTSIPNGTKLEKNDGMVYGRQGMSNRPNIDEEGMMEKEYSQKQMGIAKLGGDPDEIDAADLAALRHGAKPKSEGKLSIERAMSMMDEMIDELQESRSKKKI